MGFRAIGGFEWLSVEGWTHGGEFWDRAADCVICAFKEPYGADNGKMGDLKKDDSCVTESNIYVSDIWC